jgi:DnaJ-class molecular chaperone
MAVKDYYVVLGVPREESDLGIHATFRGLVKRYHLDRAGPDGEAILREITEAYEVLSDPERRQEYNRELGRTAAAGVRRSQQAWDVDPPPEPISPAPMSVPRDFGTLASPAEELFDRLGGGSRRAEWKGERLEPLHVCVVLSADEAERGAVLTIGLPAFGRCPVCAGSGRDSLFPCIACDAQGVVEGEHTVRVRLPPGVRDRTELEIPLSGLAVESLYLHVEVRIDRGG